MLAIGKWKIAWKTENTLRVIKLIHNFIEEIPQPINDADEIKTQFRKLYVGSKDEIKELMWRLSPQEKEERMCKGLCLYCGKPGHIIANCTLIQQKECGRSIKSQEDEKIWSYQDEPLNWEVIQQKEQWWIKIQQLQTHPQYNTYEWSLPRMKAWNSNYRQILFYLPALLKDPSTLQDISCNNQNLLIDSGATKNFVDEQEAKQLQLPTEKLNQSIWITLIDGNDSIAGLITHTTMLQLLFKDGTEQIGKFYLTKINEEHPWVLGYDWLRRYNPEINWSEPSIILDWNHEKSRAIRLFETRDQASNCSKNISNKKNLSFQDMEDQIQQISDRKQKKGVPLFGRTTIKEPIGKKITPLHETKDFIQNLRAQEFSKLVNEENLPVTLFHIHAASAEKGTKSNSGGYEAQEKDDKREMTDQEVLQAKVLSKYHNFQDVFSPEEAKELPPHRPYDHKIETMDGQLLSYGWIYNISQVKLDALKSYIDKMLGKGFIWTSNLPIGAPVLFVKKKNGTLRLCMDYWALNKITIKNRYPLPLSGDLIDHLSQAKLYTKIDLCVGYNNIHIAKGEEWKTAFRTQYGSYEYLVMPFGLTNAPVTFQHFMNDIFHDLLDVCIVVYLDDILIYSDDLETHRSQVKDVVGRLRKYDLHARPEKSGFHMDSIEYLGIIISLNGISMDPEKVKVILDWLVPMLVKELQSFLGFVRE
jgi:hypothetical protein